MQENGTPAKCSHLFIKYSIIGKAYWQWITLLVCFFASVLSYSKLIIFNIEEMKFTFPPHAPIIRHKRGLCYEHNISKRRKSRADL